MSKPRKEDGSGNFAAIERREWSGAHCVTRRSVRRGSEPERMRFSARLATMGLAGVCLTAAGCGLVGGKASGSAGIQPYSAEEMRRSLLDFGDRFESTVRGAADEIQEQAEDPRIDRAAVFWKARLVPQARRLIDNPNPMAAAADVWALCMRMASYYAEGEGRRTFGAHQATAVAACRLLEQEIEELVRAHVRGDRVAALREHVASYAAANPLRGTFADTTVRPLSDQQEQGQNLLARILDFPAALNPTAGLDRGAEAIHSLSATARGLPEETRAQLQLLALDLEEMEATRSALRSFQTLADSSSRLAKSSEALPDQVGEQARRVLEETRAIQPELRATLEQAEKTADAVDRTMDRAERLAAALERVADSAARAGQVWDATAQSVNRAVQDMASIGRSRRGEGGSADRKSDGDETLVGGADDAAHAGAAGASGASGERGGGAGFDISEYGRTADSVAAAGIELRGLAQDLQGLVDSQGLTRRMDELDAKLVAALDQATTRSQRIVDYAATRAAALIVLAFVMAAMYRMVVSRWTASKS